MKLRLLSLTLCLVLLSITDVLAAARVALVMGNAAYPGAPLRNPVNDARAMRDALAKAGFEVLALENGTKQQMERAIASLSRKLGPDTVSLFFYAGHGVQVGGRNYLLPIDAKIEAESTVRLEAVDVDAVIEQMTMAQSRINLVILDACRNNPFERRFRSTAGGLASIDAPAGTLIAYATAPGKIAADGDGSNGLYTGELVRQILTPGVPVESIFKQTRIGVLQKSAGNQTPWESSSLTGDFFFLGGQADALLNPVPPPAQLQTTRPPAPPAPAVASLPTATKAGPGPAGKDWLVGRWEGEVKGLRSKRGDTRVLTVTRVESDGRIVGGWASAQAAGIGSRAEMRLDGETVTVNQTDEQNQISLRRVGDRLEGTFTASSRSGRSYDVVMERR